MSPTSEGLGTSDEDMPKLKAELRRELLPAVKLSVIANEISRFLQGQSKKGHTREELAHMLATFLAGKFFFAPLKNSITERLIENRSKELQAIVQAGRWDEWWRLAKAIANLPPKKGVRTRPQTDDERRKALRPRKTDTSDDGGTGR